MVTTKSDADAGSLWKHQKELRDASRQLGRATRATVDDVALATRLQLEQNPYLTLGAVFAAGYVLGGGVPVRAVRFALGLGMRMGATYALRSLADRAGLVRATARAARSNGRNSQEG